MDFPDVLALVLFGFLAIGFAFIAWTFISNAREDRKHRALMDENRRRIAKP